MPQQPSLLEIIEEFKDVIPPEQIKGILDAVRTLKQKSGWGRIEIIYTSNDIKNIEIAISIKPNT